MLAILFRCLALALLFVCIIIEVAVAGASTLVAVFRDGALAAFVASFLPLP